MVERRLDALGLAAALGNDVAKQVAPARHDAVGHGVLHHVLLVRAEEGAELVDGALEHVMDVSHRVLVGNHALELVDLRRVTVGEGVLAIEHEAVEEAPIHEAREALGRRVVDGGVGVDAFGVVAQGAGEHHVGVKATLKAGKAVADAPRQLRLGTPGADAALHAAAAQRNERVLRALRDDVARLVAQQRAVDVKECGLYHAVLPSRVVVRDENSSLATADAHLTRPGAPSARE